MPIPTKIFTAEQIKAADIYTIANEPVAGIDLMERAAKACTAWIEQHLGIERTIRIFCGVGNNGGDGLAIARLLGRAGYQTEVYIVKYSDKPSEGFTANLNRLISTNVVEITSKQQLPLIHSNDLIIDALFGTGINREVTGIAADCINHINKHHAQVISIDLPSGLRTDLHTDPDFPVIHASDTLTFQYPKLAMLFAENGVRTGKWHLLDIGLSKQYTAQETTKKYYLNNDYVRSLIQSKPKFANKGTFGHALIVAGSYGKMGAAILAAKACLRSGTGLLTMHIPAGGNDIMQATVPQAMVDADSGEKQIQDAIDTAKYKSIGIGPGIGTEPATKSCVKLMLENSRAAVVIDADALNILAGDKSLMQILPANSILTPHPKEFERLTQPASNDFERHAMQLGFSAEHKVYVVLKGAHTCISTPQGDAWFNATGNPGMAKGGSGDVLTGIITGLLAQGYEPLAACLLGVYIHGLAGDMAAIELSETAMNSADIIDYLPQAFIKMN